MRVNFLEEDLDISKAKNGLHANITFAFHSFKAGWLLMSQSTADMVMS